MTSNTIDFGHVRVETRVVQHGRREEMPRKALEYQARPPSSGNEQFGSAESQGDPPLRMLRFSGVVLSDKLFLRRLALGPNVGVKGGTRSKRVLFLYARGSICVCLNCEDEQEGLERARPIIKKAIATGRIGSKCLSELERWVANRVIKRLAALSPANYQVERVRAARRLGQTPSMLDSFVESVRPSPPPYMHWQRGPGGKRVLECFVFLSDGSRLSKGLKTDDPKLAKQRIRLLLWHATELKLLPGGKNHEAWIEYGGTIPRWEKNLLKRLAALGWEEYELEREAAAKRLGYHPRTIDWLTKQEQARLHDPKRRNQARRDARSRALRKGKPIPMVGPAWQFRTGGPVLESYRGGNMYGRTMIAGVLLRWSRPVQNRAEAEVLANAVVAARADVTNAAILWSDCPEPSGAKALLKQQGRLRDVLVAAGAKRSKGWGDVESALKELPVDQKSRPNPAACTRWFVELLEKNPDRPPRPLKTVEDGIGLLEEATKRFNVSNRETRRCYERAQDITRISAWSTAHRGKARRVRPEMASHSVPAARLPPAVLKLTS
jgi:hypothetical protein